MKPGTNFLMRFRFSAIAVFIASVSSLQAGSQILSHTYPDYRNTEVRVESVFGSAAQQGALPFRIKIRNNSGRDRVWSVSLREGSYGRVLATEWRGSFAVENGTEVIHEVTLPFPPEFTSYSYRNVEATFSSPGLDQVKRSQGYQMNDGLPTLAISQRLATRSLAKLDNSLKKKNSGIQRFADSFEPNFLPGDWKAYTGLDALLIDLQSWNELNASPKRAILEWVRLGGKLHLFASKIEFPEFELKDLDIDGLRNVGGKNSVSRLSLGQIELKSWDGNELANGVETPFEKLTRTSDLLRQDFGENWALSIELGTKPFNSILIFGILLAFAILVAPVNLFYLAGKGRRHRLFITTPIISVGACLLIVLMILIGDGLGGKGYRAAFVDLQSGENERRLFITQQQVSRTGVIVNSGFESDQDLLIEPVRLEPGPFTALNQSSNRVTNFVFSGNRFSGGFFRSRSQQGFALKSAEPTRARIDVKSPGEKDEPPVLVSSLPSATIAFYYRDQRNRMWKASSDALIPPGGDIALTPVTATQYRRFIESVTSDFSNRTRIKIRNLSAEKNRFFAIPADPTSYLIETHPGIRWADDRVLLSGNLEPSAP